MGGARGKDEREGEKQGTRAKSVKDRGEGGGGRCGGGAKGGGRGRYKGWRAYKNSEAPPKEHS